MSQTRALVWVLNRLNEVGGGEKLLLEGAKYYRSIGYKVIIVTWDFNEKALFEGKYENLDIINYNENFHSREKVFKRAFARFMFIFKFRSLINKVNPELVITQGEYDVAFVYLSLIFTKFKYVFLIFGQMFQYPNDFGKYAFLFKSKLKSIVNSQIGYQNTISLIKPKISFLNNISNEVISLLRYFAVKKAISRFVFSRSVQWENKLLFGTDSIINKGAFSKTIFKEKQLSKLEVFEKLNIPLDKKILLSFSRLDPKKRIDLVIQSLKNVEEDFVLVVAGKGQDSERLEALAIENKLENRVFFLGYVDEYYANSLKYHCDIFISLDIGDFDISPFEALALNKKVIFSSEIDLDNNLKENDNIFVVEASITEISKIIKYAANYSSSKDNVSIMYNYTWENYFDLIIKNSLGE